MIKRILEKITGKRRRVAAVNINCQLVESCNSKSVVELALLHGLCNVSYELNDGRVIGVVRD